MWVPGQKSGMLTVRDISALVKMSARSILGSLKIINVIIYIYKNYNLYL